MRLAVAILTGWCALSVMAAIAFCLIRNAFPPQRDEELFNRERRQDDASVFSETSLLPLA